MHGGKNSGCNAVSFSIDGSQQQQIARGLQVPNQCGDALPAICRNQMLFSKDISELTVIIVSERSIIRLLNDHARADRFTDFIATFFQSTKEIVLCPREINFKSVIAAVPIALTDSALVQVSIHEFQVNAIEVAEGKASQRFNCIHSGNLRSQYKAHVRG